MKARDESRAIGRPRTAKDSSIRTDRPLPDGTAVRVANVPQEQYEASHLRPTPRSHSVRIFLPADASKPVYAPYLKHVPPDKRAGEFWLTNRAPDRWKNKQGIEHNDAIDSPPDCLLSKSPDTPFARAFQNPSYRTHRHRAERDQAAAARRSYAERNHFRRYALDETLITYARTGYAPVDDDDDRPREPRIHTVSRESENYDDGD